MLWAKSLKGWVDRHRFRTNSLCSDLDEVQNLLIIWGRLNEGYTQNSGLYNLG